jgi:hypothetical protein
MSSGITEAEARLALSSIDRRRQQVIAEINVPLWYWLSVAVGWVALGVLAQFGPAWGTIAGTVAFGAAHAAVAPRVLSGRHGSRRLSVRSDLVSRSHVSTLVFGFLLVMTVVTVGFALIAHADGARHAAVLASVVVAALVLSGGPSLMAPVRRRAEQHLGAP